MTLNIYRVLGAGAAAIMLSFAPARLALAQGCGSESDAHSREGWIGYRAGRLAEAEKRFRAAVGSCSADLDAVNGLGYVALRRGELRRADSLFALVVRRDSMNADGWTGAALTAQRSGATVRAAEAAARALRLDPANETARAVLGAIDPDWERPAATRTRRDTLEMHARIRGEHFEVRSPGSPGWRRIWIKGVNLGVALPGRFPTEFPDDSALYAGWLDTIAGMNANAVRVYTILPPSFYRALAAFNDRRPDRALWLVQGIWAELPPGHDFENPAWLGELHTEVGRAVDVVHGSARLAARPGHASGRYDADVSRWTLAWIVGREWEPFAVEAFAAHRPGPSAFRGRFLEGDSLSAPERWIAELCDWLLAAELDRYNSLHPIAFTNWPTLDPLRHLTEATGREERKWRRRSGRESEGATLEYDNDAIGLDASRVRSTPRNPAGWFASYHAYPYYPDFVSLDPGYSQARSREGPSNYFGYIRALREHHRGLPLLIAEYGVPSSRGNAHRQRQGWDHGGHDEREMAEIDARLTRDLHEAGTAGGIVFAWLDEWFKRNWMVLDFQVPAENTRLWHNTMDAEQNYGILALHAGRPESRPVLGGDPARWHTTGAEISLALDESFVYLGFEAGPTFSWQTHGIEIGIDTYMRDTGQHRLPRSGMRSEVGFEFLLDLVHPDSGSMRVLPEYNRYAASGDTASDDRGRFLRRPITITNRDDGRFDRMLVTSNRARFGRDGTFFPALTVDRGALKFGPESESTLADWFFDAATGTVEIRIAWDLLNVTDPSSRTLVFERTPQGAIGTVPAGDFNFEAMVYRRDRSEPPIVLRRKDWSWQPWSEPTWHARLKPVYETLRKTWAEIP